MKESAPATEMLRFVTWVRSSLQAMNSITSGWSTRRMPMFAPRRVPPCFTASVLASYSFMNEIGPRALGAQLGEPEAGAAAALVDDGHRLERVIDAVLPVRERVFHRQHEAGG